MSSVSSIHTSAPVALPPSAQARGTDADGDNDGTKAVKAAATPLVPAVAPTTDTKGNNVNLTA